MKEQWKDTTLKIVDGIFEEIDTSSSRQLYQMVLSRAQKIKHVQRSISYDKFVRLMGKYYPRVGTCHDRNNAIIWGARK